MFAITESVFATQSLHDYEVALGTEALRNAESRCTDLDRHIVHRPELLKRATEGVGKWR